MKTENWVIDQEQSRVVFKVQKLIVNTITGNFRDFSGSLETFPDEPGTVKNISFKARVDSLKTDDEQRDEHLRSADFFDAAVYPEITFSATGFSVTKKAITGELTIRHITKPIVFKVSLDHSLEDSDQINLKIYGKVDRNDFGLTWNGVNKAGEFIVGDEIKLCADARFVKQATAVPEEVV